MTAEHLKPLTSMRFMAAFWVVLFHYWPKLDLGAATGWTPGFVAQGYLGVELFFVLSGFILCHVYLSSLGEGRFKYGSFLWARLARVYPLHLATLLGVGALAAAAAGAGVAILSPIVSWASRPANRTMTHAWGLAPQAAWNHPSWSISAEWFAYLCFPAFAWAAWKLRERAGLALLLTTAGLMATYAVFEALAGFPLTQATIHWGALRIVPCFAYGCAVYLAWRSGGLRRPLGFVLASTALIVASAALQLWDGITVALFGSLILGLAGLAGRGGWLESKPAVWLGEVSYSVYIVCVPWKLLAINGLSRLNGGSEQLPLWMWALAVLAIVPLAGLCHHLIERPARDAMRRFAERRAARRLTAQPATT